MAIFSKASGANNLVTIPGAPLSLILAFYSAFLPTVDRSQIVTCYACIYEARFDASWVVTADVLGYRHSLNFNYANARREHRTTDPTGGQSRSYSPRKCSLISNVVVLSERRKCRRLVFDDNAEKSS